MDLAWIVLKQTMTMAIYMAVGYVLFKTGKITKEGSKSIATILIWLIVPAVIINSFCVEFSMDRLIQLGVSALLGALALLLSIIAARIFYGKTSIEQFAFAFSYAGFIGFPLVKASFGDSAVFFLIGFVAMLNLLQWSYGVSLLQGKQVKLKAKQVLTNPIFLAPFIGLAIFAAGFGTRLPNVVQGAISGISALNAPLAMIVLGVYLAQTDLKSMLLNYKLYILSTFRLLVIPVLTIGLFLLLPGDTEIKLAIMTAAAAPVGSNVAVYAQLYDADYPYACQTVALSTVLSVITLPLMIALANVVLGAA